MEEQLREVRRELQERRTVAEGVARAELENTPAVCETKRRTLVRPPRTFLLERYSSIQGKGT